MWREEPVQQPSSIASWGVRYHKTKGFVLRTQSPAAPMGKHGTLATMSSNGRSKEDCCKEVLITFAVEVQREVGVRLGQFTPANGRTPAGQRRHLRSAEFGSGEQMDQGNLNSQFSQCELDHHPRAACHPRLDTQVGLTSHHYVDNHCAETGQALKDNHAA